MGYMIVLIRWFDGLTTVEQLPLTTPMELLRRNWARFAYSVEIREVCYEH